MVLYHPLKFILKFTFRFWFRKRYAINNNLPKDTGIMLIANHGSAFLDPVLLATFRPEKFYFLARGDVFRKQPQRWMFEQMNQTPIYRPRDMTAEERKEMTVEEMNQPTFDKMYDCLSNKELILIFPEGDCIQEKRLRRLKKGAARMIFGAYQKHQVKNMCFVPVGLNYTNPLQLRKDVYMKFGEPVSVEPYIELFEKDAVGAILKLTKDMQQALEDCLVIIKHKETEDVCELAFDLMRKKENVWPWYSEKDTNFKIEKQVSARINDWYENDSDKYKEFSHKILMANRIAKKMKLKLSWLSYDRINLLDLFSLLFLPLFFLGAIIIYPIWQVIKMLTNKIVREKEFYPSILIGLCSVVFPIYSAIIALFIGGIFEWKVGLITFFALPLLGYFTVAILEPYKKVLANFLIWSNTRRNYLRKKVGEIKDDLINI